jgi:succinoglycan biosynthesis protein ExoO
MQNQECRASVVIPVYNSAGTLRRAVASVLCQTLGDLELLIVDDASQDASLASARELAAIDNRIRVIALPTNQGKAHAMNVAINEANGAWIAVLDADDWYEPERLEILIAAANSQRATLVADNQYFHDAAANQVVRTALAGMQGAQPLTRPMFVAGSDPYADFDYGMLKPIVSIHFIRRTGLAYRENARLSEDFLYLVDFYAAGGTGTLVHKPLYHWTQPFGSISRQWTTTGAGAWRYNYQAALDANANVLRELSGKQNRDLADLLISRARAFQQLHHLSTINRMRASGSSLVEIMNVAARHPTIWPLLARRSLRPSRT